MIARLLVLVLIFSSASAFSSDYFWVGGHGNWSDLSHWATSSGGTELHVSLPGPSDNVYFDVNSFTGLGQEVSLDLNPIEIGSLNCTGVQFFPKLLGLNFGDVLSIAGDLIIPGEMQRDLKSLSMVANSGDRYIETGGLHMGGSSFLNINGDANFYLLDFLDVNFLNVSAGAFYTGGNDMDIRLNISVFQGGDGFIDLEDSSVSTRIVELYDLGDIDASEATITLENPGFVASQGDFYGAGNYFHHLVCQDANQIFDDNQFGILELRPSAVVVFESGSSQTTGELIVTGSGSGSISMSASIVGVQATISQSSGVVNGEFLVLQDINATGGAEFNAIYTVDLGNNTGWNIDEDLPATYYWVGGSGFVTDLSHWATSSGGSEFHPNAPGQLDDIVFDENSFSSGTDVVTVNTSMTFQNLSMSSIPDGVQLVFDVSAPQWFVHGSLEFAQGLDADLRQIHMVGSSPNLTITSNGVNLGEGSELIIDGGGILNLNDALSVSRIELSSGGLISNDEEVSVSEVFITQGSQPALLDLGSSVANIGFWRPFSTAANYQLGDSEFIISKQFYGSDISYGSVRLLEGDVINFLNDCSISELILDPGAEVVFESETTIDLEALDITGTPEQRITISASEPGNAFSFAKNSGSVDAYYMDIRDNNAVGGAIFTAFESNLIAGVSGWNDANSVDEQELIEIGAWPNPFSSVLSIDLWEPMGFYLLDASGRAVIDKRLNLEGQTQIDLSDLAPGMYYLKVDAPGYNGKALLKN